MVFSVQQRPSVAGFKDDEAVRPSSVNRETVRALEERGLISHGKSRDPLMVAWEMQKSTSR